MSNKTLADVAFINGDMREIRSRLSHMGYRASILLKGPHDRIKMECAVGGKGVSAQHTWMTTPMQALSGDGGCPYCKLDHHIKSDPPEEVSEAVLAKAVKAQHKALHDSIEKSRRKLRRRATNYGADRYTI